ncbi:hypothetical protein OBBRIDRAFT_7416 [Obba rivulosa]|uniref:Uncharacterized protein n=1 Tax=Obba rivulosa TaxID=1052685 RepID=A0A8E2DVE3_9APHY|nr:hypothetical protein OBBRIDRAFT_7416 [Obba rivulosa]
METISGDPELAQELVQLLGNELKSLRQQLKESQAKNSREASQVSRDAEKEVLKEEILLLRQELGAMHLRLDAALAGQDSKSHTDNLIAYDEVCVQLSGVLIAKEKQEREHAEAMTRIEEQMNLYRQKSKTRKAERDILAKSFDELSSKLEEVAAERDSAQSESKELRVVSERALFNIESFLSMSAPNSFPLACDIINQSFKQIPHINKIKDVCGIDSFLTTKADEVIWPDTATDRCIIVTPMYRWNPDLSGSGAWEPVLRAQSLHADPLRVHDLVHFNGKRAFGTNIVQSVLSRTTLKHDMVPPMIKRMTRRMYSDGILKVECFGMRCVGFNQALFDALQAHPNSHKRKHGDDAGRSNKKAKQPA